MFQQAIDWCAAHPEAIVAAVVALLGLIKGKPWVDAVVGSSRARTILQLAHIAFVAVEEAGAELPGLETAAKIALFMDKLTKAAQAHGLGELSPAEKSLALTASEAINYTNRPDAKPVVSP